MTATAAEELHSIRIAHEVTTATVLSAVSIVVWLLVLPLELALRLSV